MFWEGGGPSSRRGGNSSSSKPIWFLWTMVLLGAAMISTNVSLVRPRIPNPVPSGEDTTRAKDSTPTKQQQPQQPPSPLMDPSHTPRLKRFRFRSGQEAPVPAFHGCYPSEKGLCRFSNVCFSRRDSMLVPDTPGLRQSHESNHHNETIPWYSPDSEYSQKIFDLRRPQLVPESNYTSWNNAWRAPRILVMNCWQQLKEEHNPSHMLMGMSHLFVHATGRWDQTENDEAGQPSQPSSPHAQFDLLLYHQCSTLEGWPWGEFVNSIFWDEAVARGSSAPPFEDAALFLPYQRDGDAVLPDDVVVCGDEVYHNPYFAGSYFAENADVVTDRWKDILDARLPNHTEEAPTTTATATAKQASVHTEEADPGTCARQLRIAAFQRNEGSSLRRFVNLEGIGELSQQYTDQPFRVITANSTTPPEEQVALFRSFDILLTCHGSHLVNMIFNGQKSVFIEISSVYYDGGPFVNGMAFAKHWINSYGHAPHGNPALAAQMGNCLNFDTEACPTFPTRSDFIHSDLDVSVDLLRPHLEEAIGILCPGWKPTEGATAPGA